MSEMVAIDQVLIENLRLTHGILACLAWVVFFPAGAIVLRIKPNRFTIWIHAITQMLAYILYIVAVVLGIWLGVYLRGLGAQTLIEYHPIIGYVILFLMFFQPALGVVHHFRFKRVPRRNFWSQAHLWIGRIVITLGILNGGLGLYFSEEFQEGVVKGEIVYGVIAGLVWIAYVAAAVWGELQRLGGDGNSTKEKRSNPSDSDSDQSQYPTADAGKQYV